MKIKTIGKTILKLFLFISFIFIPFTNNIYAANIKTNINFNPDFIQIGDEFNLIITLSSFQEKLTLNNIPDLKRIITSDKISFETDKPEILKSNTFIYTGIIISKKYTLRIVYKLKALKSGKIDLPSLNLKVNGEPIIIKSIPLIISDKIQKKAQILNSFINIEKTGDKFYPGETIVIKYYLYSIHNITEYKINNIKIPDSLFVKYNILDNKIEQLFIEEHIYNKINILNLKITTNKPGIYKIPEIEVIAKIKTTQGIKTSFNEISIKSDPVIFEYTKFPEIQPDNFIGLVGNYKFNYRYDILENKNSGFIKINFKISGEGNLNNLLLNNILYSNSYFDIIGPNRILNKDSVEFIYFAIPKYSGKILLPAIEFYYFNTQTNKFEKVFIPEEQVYIKKRVEKKIEKKETNFNFNPISIVKNIKIYKFNYLILELFILSFIPLILIPLYFLFNSLIIKSKIKSRKKIYFRSYYGLWLIFIDKLEREYNISFSGVTDDEFFTKLKKIYKPKEIEFLKKVKGNLNAIFNREKNSINYKILKKFKRWSKRIIKN